VKTTLLPAGFVALAVLVAANRPAAGQDDAADALVAQITTKVGSADKPFAMVVRFKIKQDQARKFEEMARKTQAASQKEKGCVAYEVNRDLDEPSAYVFYEQWRNVAAIKEHLQADYTKAILAFVGEAAEGPPQIHILAPLSGVPARPAK
jgi:quinol monooxygenase YgiN